jgi:hypothetical protein
MNGMGQGGMGTGAEWGKVKAAGESAAEASHRRLDPAATVSVPSVDRKNPINAACLASSASPRNAGP